MFGFICFERVPLLFVEQTANDIRASFLVINDMYIIIIICKFYYSC